MRHFLLIGLLFLALDGWCQQKPNILWITIEDTSPDFIGCYGNAFAHTPNIDKLASEGVRFTHAYSTGTVCSPSRTAIITGVKTYRAGTGHHRSNFPIPAYIQGFPFYLQQAGYYTTNAVKTDYNVANAPAFVKATWNESSAQAGWWNRKPGQPFFAVFNYNDSHQSNTMTNPYERYEKAVLENLEKNETIADDTFPMPPFYRDSPEMRKEMARVYNSISLTDKRIGELLGRLKADGLMDSTIIIFYGDHGEGIPRGKTNGISLGFRVPFIVWFPEMYKSLSPWKTGTVANELIDFTDLAPTMISLAGGVIPDHMIGRPFMGAARKTPPEHLVLSSDRSDNGLDLVRAVTDGRYFYARNFMPYMPEVRYIRYMEIGRIKQIMREDLAKGVLNPLQKSLFEPRSGEVLFDTQTDPWETRNLAGDKKYISILKKMRAVVDKEIVDARDIMFLPEGEIDLISQNSTAYEYRLDDVRYPIKDIYHAASLSGIRGEKVAQQQVKLLAHDNKIVRYWAAIGLRCQSSEDLTRHTSTLETLLSDPYPPVAITAAATLYALNNNENAAACLKKHLLGENHHWALMAVNYLLYIEEKTPFIEAVKQCRSLDGRPYATKAGCMDFLGSLGLVPNDIDHRQ